MWVYLHHFFRVWSKAVSCVSLPPPPLRPQENAPCTVQHKGRADPSFEISRTAHYSSSSSGRIRGVFGFAPISRLASFFRDIHDFLAATPAPRPTSKTRDPLAPPAPALAPAPDRRTYCCTYLSWSRQGTPWPHAARRGRGTPPACPPRFRPPPPAQPEVPKVFQKRKQPPPETRRAGTREEQRKKGERGDERLPPLLHDCMGYKDGSFRRFGRPSSRMMISFPRGASSSTSSCVLRALIGCAERESSPLDVLNNSVQQTSLPIAVCSIKQPKGDMKYRGKK